MTAISIPSTTRPDELLIRCVSDADEVLLGRLLSVLRGEGGGSATDVAVNVTLLLDLHEKHLEAPSERRPQHDAA
jgi:hypothetical protein